MRRRDFIAALAGAAATPLAARAQQAAMPVIGFVRSTSAAGFEQLASGLRLGLKEAGLVEGQNVAIEYRYADNQLDRLPALVADLIRRPVAAIVANSHATAVAKAATTTVPIVLVAGTDPVRDGLVTSLNRPGGNVTGTVFFGGDLGPKRLDLLRQLVPKDATIGALVHPDSFTTETERNDIVTAAQAMGLQLFLIEVSNEREFENAFAAIVDRKARALFVGSGAFLNTHRERIGTLAVRHKLPTIFAWRDAAVHGLITYGASQTEAYRLAGLYVARILAGEKPGNLPVIRATKVETVINLKIAKELGIEIPDRLAALADEVIE